MLRRTVLTFVLLTIGLVLTNQAYGQEDSRDERRGSNIRRESNRSSDKPIDVNGESGVAVPRIDDSRPRGDFNGGSRSRGDFNGGSRSRGDSNSGTRSGDDVNGGSRSRGDSNSGTRSGDDVNGGSRSRGDSNSGTRSGDDLNGDFRLRGDFNGDSRSRSDFNTGSRSGDDFNGGSRSRSDFNSGFRSGDDFNGGSRSRGDSSRVPTLGDNMNIVQRPNLPVDSDSNLNSMFTRKPNTVRPVVTNDVSDYSKDHRFSKNDGSFENRFEERPTVPSKNRVESHGLYERAPMYGDYSYGYKGYGRPFVGYYGLRRHPANRFFNEGYYRGYGHPHGRYRRSDVDSSFEPSFYAKNWNVQ